MCGICFLISTGDNACFDEVVINNLHHRGPDVQRKAVVAQDGRFNALFVGCTLHFRGHVTPQPVQDAHGNLLLWNAEIFGGLEVPEAENDGIHLLSLLSTCESNEQILHIMASIKGPWAFVFWQAKMSQLWFGRDYFGRRSLLLYSSDDNSEFGLSSIALRSKVGWSELPALGIYTMTLDCSIDATSVEGWSGVEEVTLWPWIKPSAVVTGPSVSHFTAEQISNFNNPQSLQNIKVRLGEFGIVPDILPFNHVLPGPENLTSVVDEREFNDVDRKHLDLWQFASLNQEHMVDRFIATLREAIKTRIQLQSNMCDFCLRKHFHKKHKLGGSYVKCDLKHTIQQSKSSQHNKCVGLNKSFDSHHKLHEPLGQEPFINSGYECDKMPSGCQGSSDKSCSEDNIPPGIGSSTEGCNQHVMHSSSDTVLPEDRLCISDVHDLSDTLDVEETDRQCGHSRVAVLFSGGIDSLVLTALLDKVLDASEPVDLLNVAFQQQLSATTKPGRKQMFSDVRSADLYEVPDRVTGREGLHLLSPDRQWNFVEINVTVQELQKARSSRIGELVYPLQTVLDDSIGCAIWFAAKGNGFLRKPDGSRNQYTSTARVVLVGMGADEQLAGYSRHRVKFNTGGWSELVKEIEMEIDRISARNLGRDDRIIADHGKEARFPFLDEDVVSFLNSLPIWEKADLRYPRGIGEKLLLRLAATKLGLCQAATLPKRAIQFGSRIAKLENRKEKATEVCTRLEIK